MTVRREIPESRSETGAWSPAKDRGVLEQYVEGLSGEPARLHAAVAACRLVAAANPGYPLLCEMQRVNSRSVHESCGLVLRLETKAFLEAG